MIPDDTFSAFANSPHVDVLQGGEIRPYDCLGYHDGPTHNTYIAMVRMLSTSSISSPSSGITVSANAFLASGAVCHQEWFSLIDNQELVVTHSVHLWSAGLCGVP